MSRVARNGAFVGARRGVSLVLMWMPFALACNAILGNESRTHDDDGPPAGGTVDTMPTEPADAATTCEADLSSDTKNCGACGHDCLGGACTGGVCQPFVVGTGLPGAANLAVDESGTFFFTTNDGAVRSCPAIGCGSGARLVTRLSPDAANPVLTGLAVRAGTVYFSAYYESSVYSCPVGGCTAPTPIVATIPNPYDLVTDETNLYMVSASAPFVARCALPSCAGGMVKIAMDGLGAHYGANVDGAHVYWYGGGPNPQFERTIVYRALKTQSESGSEVLLRDRTVKGAGPSRANLAVRNGELFLAEDGPTVDGGALTAGTVTRFAEAGKGVATVLATKQPAMRGISVDESHVYWTSYKGGVIKRCAIGGCNDAPTVVASSLNGPCGPVLSKQAVYWTEYFAGTIRGVAK